MTNYKESLIEKLEAVKYHKDCGNANCEAYFAGIARAIDIIRQHAAAPDVLKNSPNFDEISRLKEKYALNTAMGGVRPQAISQEQPVDQNDDNVSPSAQASEILVNSLEENGLVNLIAPCCIEGLGGRHDMARLVINKLRPYLRTTVPVSLEKCARAMCESMNINPDYKKMWKDYLVHCRTVLDAAGVKYV